MPAIRLNWFEGAVTVDYPLISTIRDSNLLQYHWPAFRWPDLPAGTVTTNGNPTAGPCGPPLIVGEHCDVTCWNSYPDGTEWEWYQRWAQTAMSHYRGGKGIPGVTSLFKFHVSAIRINDPKAEPPSTDPNTGEYNTGVTPIPGTDIFIGGFGPAEGDP